MTKKLLFSLAPLLVVAAFAMTSAAAQAQTTYGTCAGSGTATNCPGGNEIFTPFPGLPTRTQVEDKKVSAEFTLETVAGGTGFKCTTFSSIGWMWNTAGVGRSSEALAFDGCKGFGELEGCPTPNETGVIEGFVTDKVLTATTVEITVEGGFNIECPAPIGPLGKVTGKATGTQTAKTAVLKFAGAPGLTLATKPSKITGEAETEVISNSKKVYI